MIQSEKQDPFKELFRQLPTEQLPVDFRSNMMHQIMGEVERVKKRNERWMLVAIVAASLIFVGLGIGAFYFMGFTLPEVSATFKTPTFELPSFSKLPSVLYLGVLTLLLLFGDHKIRRTYYKKHKEE
jgi:hypothetical protein